MYINTFKYTPKDVSCQLCTEYVKKLGCTALRCPWLAERIEAGVVGYKRVEEAKATAKYMDDKAAHYAAILAGLAPDDTNPKNWTAANRPKHKAEKL